MRILILGNMGYVGPLAVREFRARWPEAKIAGFDTGFFGHCLLTRGTLPEVMLNEQIFGDVRSLTPDTFAGFDAVVYLAALSNDVLGNLNEDVTLEINYRSAIRAAELAKAAGARSFVFASSCSVYGYAENTARTERSEVNPLTAYAKSKVFAERDLEPLAERSFRVTCLRFATACGMSERLRLDLVLNDFVAAAVTSGTITILSDGTPWRPLIDVKDMARALAWAITREGSPFVLVNAGSDEWNYRVSELAAVVAEEIPGTSVSINTAAVPDRRSYRVDFSTFRELAPADQPESTIQQSVREVVAGLRESSFHDREFRQSPFMRIHTLTSLRSAGRLREDLTWARS
jgi:nucleoside-diphosphate-sugar epimerase